MKKAYAFAADGTEESELLCVVDALKRADVEVKIISVSGEIFTSSHGVRIVADGVITAVRQMQTLFSCREACPVRQRSAATKRSFRS